MEIKKNFARKIDSKLKKSTIIGIKATYSVIVVPNAVTRLRGYAVTRLRGYAVTLENMKMEGRGRNLYINIFYIIYIL